MPKPPLVLLVAHKGPQFVDFGVIHTTDHDIHVVGGQGV
jgi:hypothetical protein